MEAPTSPSSSGKTVQRWRCDVCRSVYFEDFEEACQHEAQCKKQSPQLVQPRRIESESKKVPSKKKDSARQRQPKPIRVPITTTLSTATPNDEPATTSTLTATATTTSKVQPKEKPRKSTREVSPDSFPRDALSTSKCKTDTKEKPTHSFFAPRNTNKRPNSTSAKAESANSHLATSASSQSNKLATRSGSGSATRNAKKAKTTADNILTVIKPTIDSHGNEIYEIDQDSPTSTSAKPHPLLKTQKKPPKPPSRSSLPRTVTRETCEETANALAAIIDSQLKGPKKLAGIFSNKPMEQLLAEQRQAEFQAKRRLERQNELSRQQKRMAQRHTVTEDSTTDGQSQQASPSGQQHVACRVPLDLRFPVPNHVLGTSALLSSSSMVGISPQPQHHWMDIASQKSSKFTHHVNEDAVQPSATFKLLSSVSDLDSNQPDRDLIQEAFANILIPPNPSTGTHQSLKTSASVQWSDKYSLQRHEQLSAGILGDSTRRVADTLQAWIRKWCLTRQRAMERMKERHRQLATTKKAQRRKVLYKDDFENDSDDDAFWRTNDSQLDNVYLLTGPPASGKTSLVHAVAKACDCNVLEINTTMPRNATALKRMIQEATQSCSTSHLFQQQQTSQQLPPQQGQLLHTRKTQPLQDSDDDSDSDDEDSKKQPTASLTVILIDEIDLIFEAHGDTGFWSALTSVAKTARCPILLTSNSSPSGMSNIRHQHVALNRPCAEDCSSKILQVCREEGIGLQAGLDPMDVQKRLSWIATVLNCDMRRLLLELQWFAKTQGDRPVKTPTTYKIDKGPSKCSPTTFSWPVIHAVVPQRIPTDKYTVVTLHGDHFASLLTKSISGVSNGSFVTYVGSEKCPAQVTANDTILVLCPPCTQENLDKRIVPIYLESNIFGRLDGSSIKADDLVDGSSLKGAKRLHVEYLRLEEPLGLVADDTEEEFELDSGKSVKSKLSSSSKGHQTKEDGDELWKKTLAEECIDMPLEPLAVSTIARKDASPALVTLAEHARNSSDAALLEDLMGGLPYLSGACRGFAFDLTDGELLPAGMAKRNDNCRPPSEDHLFALGWKEYCYFHGGSETYMTFPGTTHERRALANCMKSARGSHSMAVGPTVLPEKDGSVDPDEWEDVIKRSNILEEEDMFLPRTVPILLESLPQLLRTVGDYAERNQSCWSDNQLLEQRRDEQQVRMRGWISTMFDPSTSMSTSRSKIRTLSRELLLLNGSMHSVLITEFLPTLRRLAAIEASVESVQGGDSPERDVEARSSRRATRLQARNARKHYFDTISRKLELDDADVSSSQLGQAMAQSLLNYDAPYKQSNKDSS